MMLDCDRCHRWFHGPCVGIASQEVQETLTSANTPPLYNLKSRGLREWAVIARELEIAFVYPVGCFFRAVLIGSSFAVRNERFQVLVSRRISLLQALFDACA